MRITIYIQGGETAKSRDLLEFIKILLRPEDKVFYRPNMSDRPVKEIEMGIDTSHGNWISYHTLMYKDLFDNGNLRHLLIRHEIDQAKRDEAR
jgi:hypothetical protein